MEKSNIMIRLEKKEEYQKVENLVRESFWNVYRPGCLEHYVLHQLRNDPAFVPELDFVMLLNENDEDGKLIGQNMFMRTSIKADDGRNIPIMTMGPICITPELKRQGYGKVLLDYSLDKAAKFGCGAVCFEGNPIRLYTISEISKIFSKLGMSVCKSYADFTGKLSSDNDIQLMVYSVRN